MRNIQLLIKPASSLCNLRCGYCFYRDETQHREVASHGIMSQETLELTMRKALEAAQESCIIGFQGGEPTLAGLDFYKNVVKLAEKYKKPETYVGYSLQTNGILIDDEWLDFLEEHRFWVGLSVDGDRSIHDRNRPDAQGKETYARTVRVWKELQRRRIDSTVLCVLTRQSARRIRSVYENLKKIGAFQLQFIPCLDPIGKERGGEVYSLTPKLYAEALKTLFDLWFEDLQKGVGVYIRTFENYVGILRGEPPEACAMYGRCSQQNVVEADGSIYPCDFYALDEYCQGNIRDTDFEKIHMGIGSDPFFADAQQRGDDCASCRWYPLCRGGCRRDCFEDAQHVRRNYYCEAYREFFAYTINRLEYLAGGIR